MILPGDSPDEPDVEEDEIIASPSSVVVPSVLGVYVFAGAALRTAGAPALLASLPLDTGGLGDAPVPTGSSTTAGEQAATVD